MSVYVSGIEWKVTRESDSAWRIFRRVPRRGWQLKAEINADKVIMLDSYDDGLTCWFAIQNRIPVEEVQFITNSFKV